MSIYQCILAPIDGSETAECGMREAIRIAKDQQAQLRFLFIVDAPRMVTYYGATALLEDMLTGAREHGAEVLEQAVQAAREHGVQAESVIVESTAERVSHHILEHVRQWAADLVVIGTHGRRGISHLVMGSDAEEVVRLSPVPVLLVRKQASPA